MWPLRREMPSRSHRHDRRPADVARRMHWVWPMRSKLPEWSVHGGGLYATGCRRPGGQGNLRRLLASTSRALSLRRHPATVFGWVVFCVVSSIGRTCRRPADPFVGPRTVRGMRSGRRHKRAARGGRGSEDMAAPMRAGARIIASFDFPADTDAAGADASRGGERDSHRPPRFFSGR